MEELQTFREIGMQIEQFSKLNTEQHKEITKSIECMDDTLKAHNGRLKNLEKLSYIMQGALWVIGVSLGTFILPLAIQWFKNIHI